MMSENPTTDQARRAAGAAITRRALLGAALAFAAVALAAPGGARADAPAGEFSVRAKLVEIPSTLPPDDLYDYAYVMRYEVIGGPMDKQSILVAHYKPRMPRAKIKDGAKLHVGGKLRSFTQGDIHKLKLSPDLKKLWKGALVDEFAATDRKSVRYWCLEADPD
jgi:hypothetical protein